MKIVELIQEIAPVGATTKKPGFLQGMSKGFKQSTGIDPNDGLAKGITKGLAVKALNATGFRNTAHTLDTSSPASASPFDTQTTSAPTPTATGASTPAGSTPLPEPGSTVNHPKLGRVKVLPSLPGQPGIRLDTQRTVGHNIYVDPSELSG